MVNIALVHGNVEWIVSGFVVFAGLMVFMIKMSRGKILDCVIGAAVWYFVYKIHSGSTAGIMTATLAALLFDIFGVALLRLTRK